MIDINRLTESLNKKYKLNESASFESDIYNWLSNHYGETSWKDKFNSYIEKIKSSGYNTSRLSSDINKAIKKFSKEVKVKPSVFTSALKESLDESYKKKLSEGFTDSDMVYKLRMMYVQLDDFQETDEAQGDEELMWLIGETMGSIDNILDYITSK